MNTFGIVKFLYNNFRFVLIYDMINKPNYYYFLNSFNFISFQDILIYNIFSLGWRMKREVNLKTDSAVWLLGRCYHNKLNGIFSLLEYL